MNVCFAGRSGDLRKGFGSEGGEQKKGENQAQRAGEARLCGSF